VSVFELHSISLKSYSLDLWAPHLLYLTLRSLLVSYLVEFPTSSLLMADGTVQPFYVRMFELLASDSFDHNSCPASAAQPLAHLSCACARHSLTIRMIGLPAAPPALILWLLFFFTGPYRGVIVS